MSNRSRDRRRSRQEKMRRRWPQIACLVLVASALTGCASSTDFGTCVGIGEAQNPKLVYKVSIRNLFWAVVGMEFIAPPIFVAVDETFCPVGFAQ